ncbi:hypothetical protein N7481_011435 [Penicillium waksmanii]|uniref:uncharacterized protein n=1 Tax=Penicillium waksmanii TaxID=69791 RepID=UPI0025466CF6|nr:uncharacterized protein N7481_011435 [Penicillium waksmanii]KAJ5974225.1 hypothetical protein N7481_011435 [Penicillium waksmanii]
MSYHDGRRYGESHGRNRGYAADYYDEHPESRRYDEQRDYGSRQARRPRPEFRRRASSIGGDPSYHLGNRSQRNSSRPYKDSERPSGSSSRHSRSSRDQNRRQSTGEASRANDYQDRHQSGDKGPVDSNRDQGSSGFLRGRGGELLMHAALPLMAAGAAEALRARKEPGEWKGDKGKHVLTAAVTNGLVNKDPSKPQKHHIMDTTFRGLYDGAPSREERAELQRRVGGSHTSSNLKKIAVAGVVAFAGKELYDRYGRSRSRARDYNDDRYGSKKRSQSVSDDRHRGMESPDHGESDDQKSARYKDRDGQSNHWERYSSRDRDYRNWDYSSDGYSDSDMENNYHGRKQGSRDLAR